MVRTINRLTSRSVDAKKRRGYYADGGGLYLQISKYGSKSWVFRFTLNGKSREMGLGSLHTYTLQKAREKARDCRELVDGGIDPIEARKAKRAGDHLEAAKAMTFADCADAYIRSHRHGWRNAKHASQWVNTLEAYVYPVLGQLPVQTIDTALVTKTLEPIWTTIPETAARVRGRIEAVLDWAKAHGFRVGDNPARWRGHLDKLLPKRSKVRAVQHHPALPYSELPTFMSALQQQDGIAARALEFLILTAARMGEVIEARWNEFDPSEKVWTIPAERMKSKKEHRVPLSPSAIGLIESMAHLRQSDYVFPGVRHGKPLLEITIRQHLGRDDLTVHGFRSTFRDWAAERTNCPREVAEAALAHALSDKVEAAYRRGDLFEKRRKLMAEWARYCNTPARSAKVVALNRA